MIVKYWLFILLFICTSHLAFSVPNTYNIECAVNSNWLNDIDSAVLTKMAQYDSAICIVEIEPGYWTITNIAGYGFKGATVNEILANSHFANPFHLSADSIRTVLVSSPDTAELAKKIDFKYISNLRPNPTNLKCPECSSFEILITRDNQVIKKIVNDNVIMNDKRLALIYQLLKELR
jgi:hypothetical protein